MESSAQKYPKYYKAVPEGVPADEVDTYVINMMFPVDDASGTILHARKKLLIPGVRSGGKSLLKDVIEARDTLNRFIALHSEPEVHTPTVVTGTVTEDGWIAHVGNDMPEPLSNEQLVDVKLRDGTVYEGNFAKQAADWIWVDDGMHSRISHYRLSRIEHGVPQLDDWKEHDTLFMPAGLDQDEMVEVSLSNGHEVIMAKRAYQWDWAYRQQDDAGAPHIIMWRRYRFKA